MTWNLAAPAANTDPTETENQTGYFSFTGVLAEVKLTGKVFPMISDRFLFIQIRFKPG